MSGTHVHVSRTGAVEIRGARGFASSKLRVNSLRVPSAGIWAGLREAAVESSSPTTSPTARLPTLSRDGAWLYFIATAEVRSSENRSF